MVESRSAPSRARTSTDSAEPDGAERVSVAPAHTRTIQHNSPASECSETMCYVETGSVQRTGLEQKRTVPEPDKRGPSRNRTVWNRDRTKQR